MVITVNGKILNMNIGCRTFTSVNKLLELLKGRNLPSSIELNGQSIDQLDFVSTSVKDGDILVFSDSPIPG